MYVCADIYMYVCIYVTWKFLWGKKRPPSWEVLHAVLSHSKRKQKLKYFSSFHRKLFPM